jgi:prolyl-tRNA editing enzyme YbaK/EbsC (Cys-tRNA(Pro) deacylase)
MGLYEDIKTLLDENSIKYEESEHEPVMTSQAAADARNLPLSSGVKAMILRSKGKFYLFALRAHKKLDWKKVRSILQTDSVSLATPEEVLEVTGVEIGAVAPFGNLMGIPTYSDESVFAEEKFDFSCGKHEKSMELGTKDWEKVVQPIHSNFSQD